MTFIIICNYLSKWEKKQITQNINGGGFSTDIYWEYSGIGESVNKWQVDDQGNMGRKEGIIKSN